MASQWSQDLYIQAYRFAAIAHNGQFVPGTELPYLMHISFVAMEVISALGKESGFNGDLAVQCALLHDTIEDTDTTYDQLNDDFGSNVSEGVLALTKDPTIGSGVTDKLERKKLRMEDSLRRILKQPKEIWLVKMADRISNLQPPPNYWTKEKIFRYKEEAIEIYNTLSAGSQYLSDRLKKKIDRYAEPMEQDQKYTVFVDDNYHYMDESERYEKGTYSSYKEALLVSKHIVDEFFRNAEKGNQEPCDPNELYESYVDFGEDPFITPEPAGQHFSAWDYAKKRAKQICEERLKEDGSED